MTQIIGSSGGRCDTRRQGGCPPGGCLAGGITM